MALSWTFTDSTTTTSVNAGTFSHSFSIGTATSDRIVVVSVNNTGTGNPTMTIGGSGATQIAINQTWPPYNYSGILQYFYLAVPTGTTSTIVISASNIIDVAMSVGILSGAASTPGTAVQVGPATEFTTTTTPNLTATVPTGGIVIASFNVDRSVSGASPDANCSLDSEISTSNASMGLLTGNCATAGSQTVGFTGATNAVYSGIGVPWSPSSSAGPFATAGAPLIFM